MELAIQAGLEITEEQARAIAQAVYEATDISLFFNFWHIKQNLNGKVYLPFIFALYYNRTKEDTRMFKLRTCDRRSFR